MTTREIALPGAPDAGRAHLIGAALAATGAVFWSLGALFIRLVEADAWTLLFWRSTFIALGMLAYLAVVNRGRIGPVLRGAGWGLVLAGFFMALSMVLYINSITRTSVANTLIILAINPFIAAFLAWAVLRERVTGRTWIAMAIAVVGMVAMVWDSLDSGNWFGDLLAVGCAATFALTMVILRKLKNQDTLPQVVFAGAWAVILTLPVASPLATSARDILLCAFMGICSLGIGMLLFVYGLRYISAAEAGLLSLLESILAPVWVWLALGERPSNLALVGGVIVLGAVAMQAALTPRPPPK
ncbi:MAG: DMT family transporter [Rhodospirillales bacterium]|nr:DMT family transporter [Rhodospirillales bacterium]